MGDRDQRFREFFDAEFRALRRLGFALAGDWAQAEDLAQDALVRTYRAWSRIQNQEAPGAYARRVLVNRHRSLLRRLMVERKHASAASPPVARSMGEDGIVLWEALRGLPARQRAALVLRYYEDMPDADIALVLECPVGTVKSLIHRGLGRLRASLGPSYEVAGAGGEMA